MYRRLLKDASLYSASSVLARGFSFLSVPIFTRILSPADYGALDLLTYMAMLIFLVLGAAIEQAVGRFYVDNKDEKSRREIASTALFYNVIIFSLFVPLAPWFAQLLSDRWLDGHVGPGTVLIVFGFTWAQAIFNATNNQLRYVFMAREYALCNVGNVILSTLLGFAFLVWLRLGVAGVFLGQMLGQIIFSGVSIYLARGSYGLTFKWPVLRRMLKYSLPLVPGSIAFFVMQYVDRYALNELKGLSEVGVYGMAARIASLLNLFLMGFQGAWWPLMLEKFREPGAPIQFRNVFNAYLLVTLTLLVSLSLLGREMLLLLTTPEFAEGFTLLPPLVFSVILGSIAAYFTYGIQIAEKSHYRLILNVTALVTSVVLNFALIPAWGVMGAAIANVSASLLLVIPSLIISQRFYPVPYQWAGIIGATVLALAVSCSVILVHFQATVLGVAVKLFAIMLLIPVMARLLGVPLDRKALRVALSR